MVSNPTPQAQPVTLLRRLGALFYDSLLIGACVLIAGGILNTVVANILNLPELHPHAGPEIPAGSKLASLLFIIEVLLAFALVGWFWTHGGQTLGMRAWKIRVVTFAGQALNWQQAAMRFIAGIGSALVLGVGFIMALVDPQKLTWHDRLSRTYLIRTDV